MKFGRDIIRSCVALPCLLAAWLAAGAVAYGQDAPPPAATAPPTPAPAAAPAAVPAPRKPAGPPRPLDKKKEALKGGRLLMDSAWRVSLPAPAATTPAADAERAFVPLRSDTLAALSLADGKTIWSVPEADLAGGPEAGDDLVFIPHPRAVEALDAASGQQKWRRDLPTPLCAALLWQPGRVVAALESGDVAALATSTGEVVWKVALGSRVTARPVGDADHVYLALADSRVVALAAGTGATSWATTIPARGTTVGASGAMVYVGAADRFLYGLDAPTGRNKWRWRTGGTSVGQPVADDQFVYFLSLDNVLRALDRASGTQEWKAELNQRPTTGPFLSGRLLLVPGMSMDLYAYHFIDGADAGSMKFAGEPIAPPRFLPGSGDRNGQFLVVTGEGEAQLVVTVLPGKRPNGLPMFALPPVIEGTPPALIDSPTLP